MNNATLTREQVRELDRQAITDWGLPELLLMENAGRGCADLLERLGISGPVVIACGRGNNGGDGLVLARHLDLRGYAVRLLVVGDLATATPATAFHWQITQRLGVPWLRVDADDDAITTRLAPLLSGAQWIVDALLGTGVRGSPRPPVDHLLRYLNVQPARKLAVDLPSGLDADTGEAYEPTFRADHTCTLVARKAGFAQPAAADWIGQVHVADIGAPRALVSRFGVG